jgi:tyrosyl-tRNA synthetase
MNNCYNDLKERDLIYDTIGNVANGLNNNKLDFYVGVDPSGNGSGLHVGHLLAFIVCKHLQRFGHTPHIIIGGATSALGDPSGKMSERPEISLEQIAKNTEKIVSQVKKILGDDIHIVNNNEWMSHLSFVDFMREMGKVITVNQMLSKSSIKDRIAREQGLSLQEFNYMTVQGYDFLHMYRTYNCSLEIGGQDQWSNIEVGITAINKKEHKNALGLTWPLVIDPTTGKKFGKSEGGKNIWLDGQLTSPYDFYQFFLNVSDEQAESLIKKFTMIELDEIYSLIEKHRENPSERLLQKTLAKYMTIMIHSEKEYNKAIEASNILFGKGTKEQLETIDEDTLLGVMSGVNKTEISHNEIKNGINIIEIALKHDKIPSKGEARKLIKGNGFAINKVKITDDKSVITESDLIGGKYLLLQKGKKDYTLAVVK